ncbi:MAG: RNA polymerase sigma factor [Vicinamibacterales bacterium]
MTGQALVLVTSSEHTDTDPQVRLAALFDAHQARLFRLARRLAGSGEDARDLVQETFLRAARSPHSVPMGASHEEAWLVRVLINICRDRWRQVAVRRFHQPTLARPETAVDPESALIARSLIWQALAQLPPRRRAILILYELEGSAIPAIARLLGVTAVTVRWHLSVGRRELARAISPGDLS